MYFKIIFLLFIVAISGSSSLNSGLRVLLPEMHREYIFTLKSNVSTGTWNPKKSTTYWQLHGRLHVQVYDNFTRARFHLNDLEKLACCTNYGSVRDDENPDDKYLKEPWDLDYQDNGLIKYMYVGQEPAWSVNLKRAISINFQLIKSSGTYSTSEPCLDDICAMIYTTNGNIVKKYTSLKIPTARSRNSWSSVPWSIDYTGRAIIDSVSSAERTYDLDDDKGLRRLDLRGSYQYKTHDHILAVNTDLSLSYDHDKPAPSVEKIPNLYQTSVQYVASDFTEPTNGIRNSTQAMLKNCTYDILLKIARKGIDADNVVRNASLIHNLDFIELLNTISRLNYETLVRLFDDLVLGTSYELETSRNIFLEILPHARSTSVAKFIKYLVLEEKKKIEDAALLSLIRKLPFNIASPSQKLLEELEVFSKLGLDFPSDIRHAGILSFATLVHKTMESSQVKQDYFDNIVVKYFRMYSDCPQYLDRMIWLQGLCNIGYSAESYTRIIYTDSSRDRHERLWAALAGHRKTEQSYTIIETTLPILTNETEHIQLRIIALHMFLSSTNVRETDFMFVHNYLMNCGNYQLKRFWFATIKNLEANKYFNGYRVTSFYVPFIINQISNPDPLYWATNNYIISAQEEDGTPALQVFSVGDPVGVLPSFIGAKLSTGGRRPYKTDVYLLVEGVTTSVLNKFYVFNNDLNFEKLVELLKKMKAWAVKTPEKVHIDVVVKIHDKTVFATHMNQSRFESWNMEDLAYIEDFLRFGSHINQQIVYYPFQTDVNMPSELGTPIRLQSTILSFTSIRGNLTAPTAQDSTWKNDLHIRYQGTSVTTLSTVGPLVSSVHAARIQQSLVGHIPIKFNVSFSSPDKSLELTWPNPGAQQGGIAMHSRAQISVETTKTKTLQTVTSGDNHSLSAENKGIFFDCERPLTGAELLDKLLTSKTNHYDFLTSVQPSLIILNSILLFTAPPSGSCGLILPPQHLMKTENDVLRLTIQLNHVSVNEDTTKLDLDVDLKYFSREEPKTVFFEMSAVTHVENTGGNANIQLTVHGRQPNIDNTTRKEWTICLREQDISHAASEQDISIHPASYEGHLTLTYSGNKTGCFESGPASELTLKYKGVPQNLYGKLERFFEIKIFGSNISEMGILDSDLVTQTALGQLLRSYSREPLNMTAVIKMRCYSGGLRFYASSASNFSDYLTIKPEHSNASIAIWRQIKERNGLASVSINKGTEMQFKSDNFAWLLDSWTDIQTMKTFGLYRECRIHKNKIQMLFGGAEELPATDCEETLVLADCSAVPRFAVLRQKNSIKVYTGGYFVLVKENPHEEKLVVDTGNAGNYFSTSQTRNTVKIVSRLTDLQVYYNRQELAVLVPHMYLNTICGVCSDVQTYSYC